MFFSLIIVNTAVQPLWNGLKISVKYVPPGSLFGVQDFTKFSVNRGSASWEVYNVCPDPLVGLEGDTLPIHYPLDAFDVSFSVSGLTAF